MSVYKNFTVGDGAATADLTIENFNSILREALSKVEPDARVMAIIPDKTRDDNTPELFPLAARILAERRISKLDVLVAQGTHSPMTEREKLSKIGAKTLADIPLLENIFDHDWSDSDKLTVIGEFSREQVLNITGGLFDRAIPLTINKLLARGNYDLVIIFGGVVPHEVAGFAGGAKYFFRAWQARN